MARRQRRLIVDRRRQIKHVATVSSLGRQRAHDRSVLGPAPHHGHLRAIGPPKMPHELEAHAACAAHHQVGPAPPQRRRPAPGRSHRTKRALVDATGPDRAAASASARTPASAGSNPRARSSLRHHSDPPGILSPADTHGTATADSPHTPWAAAERGASSCTRKQSSVIAFTVRGARSRSDWMSALITAKVKS